MSNLLDVVETSVFYEQAAACMTEVEKDAFIAFIAANPKKGDLIKEGGGIRKVRWSIGNKGKSGGVRVIYYFHSMSNPIYLLTVYSKGHKANISKAQLAGYRRLIERLKALFSGKGD